MKLLKILISAFNIFLISSFPLSAGSLNDLDEIKKNGKIRHLGVYYARFNTGFGDGFSVELVKGFAKEIGVKYEFVKSDFSTIISDLTGKDLKTSEKTEIKGDIIETGFTVLEERKKYVNFAAPVFPTQVWFITSADFPVSPIEPGSSLQNDILKVKSLLAGISVLGIKDTCVDPDLYGVRKSGGIPVYFEGGVNDLAPAVIKNYAKASLLDVADTLVALEKWPGKIKVIGPLSEKQYMASAFRKDSSQLKDAYEKYLVKIFKNGDYESIVRKYYPDVFLYYPDFFKDKITGN
ncbi:MAG: transporter substrate-binding domain-containing protein [Desulforegulaceae bacterium]|nr:transporter substrate-binding domain-containing protein [Desulforegulaceae bacterium]